MITPNLPVPTSPSAKPERPWEGSLDLIAFAYWAGKQNAFKSLVELIDAWVAHVAKTKPMLDAEAAKIASDQQTRSVAYGAFLVGFCNRANHGRS